MPDYTILSEVTVDIEPKYTKTVDVGSPSKYFKDGYFDNIHTSGAVYDWNSVVVTSDYTASASDFILADASAGNITITLPAPVDGAKVAVKKIDSSANTVTINPNATEKIDGLSSLTLSTQYESYYLYSDGSNWYIL